MSSLAYRFLSTLGWPDIADDARTSLEEALVRAFREGQTAWPQLAVEPEEYARFLAERATSGMAANVARMPAADLFLACACAHGDAAGLAQFEERLASQVPAFVARMRLNTSQLDELMQRLRDMLFVSTAGTPPGIASYGGQGPLGGWLRVVAVREAMHLAGKEASRDRELDFDADGGADPELALIKQNCQAEFRAAFQEVVERLERRERALLRLHFLDGLGIDELGRMHGVHRATAARWLARLREEILEATRRRLGERLGLSAEECESVMRLARSQLEVSVERWLRDPEEGGS